MDCIEKIFDCFRLHGGDAYFGEAVSQQEHALQAASLAVREGAPEALVAAALLHDIGPGFPEMNPWLKMGSTGVMKTQAAHGWKTISGGR